MKSLFAPRLGLFVLIVSIMLSACAPAATPAPTAVPAAQADLTGIKAYLLTKTNALKASTAQVKAAGDAYYALAEAAGFDHAALWASASWAGVPPAAFTWAVLALRAH